MKHEGYSEHFGCIVDPKVRDRIRDEYDRALAKANVEPYAVPDLVIVLMKAKGIRPEDVASALGHRVYQNPNGIWEVDGDSSGCYSPSDFPR